MRTYYSIAAASTQRVNGKFLRSLIRQRLRLLIILGTLPVSYTHLDVYKRQVSALLILLAGAYTGLYRVDDSVNELGKTLLIVFALYAPVKVENMRCV